MRVYTRASFAQVRATLALDWELGVIDVHGDTAAAEVEQHGVRRQLPSIARSDVRSARLMTGPLRDACGN